MAEAPQRRLVELEKFMMFSPTPNVEGRRSKLTWGVREANPRIVVYTNDPADKEQYGMISARMDPVTFFSFLDELEKLARSPGEGRGWVECMTGEYENDKATGRKIKDSTLYYGKNAEGLVWLMVDSAKEGRPKVRFVFEISDYHCFFKSDGTAMTRGEASSMAAISTVKNVRTIVNNIMSEQLSSIYSEKAAARAANSKNRMGSQRTQSSKPSASAVELEDFTF